MHVRQEATQFSQVCPPPRLVTVVADSGDAGHVCVGHFADIELTVENSSGCALDVGIYVLCYFVRLQLMSRRAKSTEPGANVRYFVEEQMAAASIKPQPRHLHSSIAAASANAAIAAVSARRMRGPRDTGFQP